MLKTVLDQVNELSLTAKRFAVLRAENPTPPEAWVGMDDDSVDYLANRNPLTTKEIESIRDKVAKLS